MTVIAAAVDPDGTIWMGGDAVSLEHDSCVRIGAQAKVFHKGEFLVGSTGTLRVRQIMEHLFEPPAVEGPLPRYMVQRFVDDLRVILKEQGGESKKDNDTTEIDGCYLVGLRGQLFHVDSGYGVLMPRLSYHAIGCAAQEAMAAMFTAQSILQGASGKEIVTRGLQAAAEFDVNIRPPFTILNSAGESLIYPLTSAPNPS